MSSSVLPAQPEKILKALGQVWTSLGEEERDQGKPTVLRACAMTLIVATDDEDTHTGAVAQTLVELMHVHPSRAIVLRVVKDEENGLAARVFAQCWKPFGKAQQICCEQIEISARPERWLDVGPAALGIVVPDLPVVVWCRQRQVLVSGEKNVQRAGLEPVLALATKIIIDSSGSDRVAVLNTLREWRRAGRVVADLEWTRLTPWRETIATVFDDPAILSQRHNIHTVEIAYGDAEPSTGVLYIAAWLEHGLHVKSSLVRQEDAAEGLQRITLQSDTLRIDLSRSNPTCLQLTIGDKDQRVSLAGSSQYELMNEELSVLGPDAAFDAAFNAVGGI